jgi:hypothetical protein
VLAVAAVWMSAAAGLVLALVNNWQTGLAGVLAAAALVLLTLNLRELVGRPRRRRRGGRIAGAGTVGGEPGS